MAKPEYIQKNRAWLEAKSQEDGVKPLDKGIFYKIIKSGKADGPT
ncbi:MAG: FKBP-type peptidyl-prolyl cis-trans isomerase, partial [Duncaniella sp.]|nr:FKBP-type peptidyl-prolyl cis-trans isomerase [Duncaniella sp.]